MANKSLKYKHTNMNKIRQHFFHKSGWAVFSVITWEVVEELLEEVIAYCLSSAFAIFITKTITTVGIVIATIGLKKLLFRISKPIIKKITYKEGNDKMTKIKKFFTCVGKWLFANKKTLLGTVSTFAMTLTGTGIIDVSALPDLTVKGFNITPYIYFFVLGIGIIVGLCGKGFESIEEFFERMGLIKAEKEQVAIMKQAEKELKAEEKLANQTQAEQEKLQAKKDAEEKAKAEKEKAEAEYRAKVEQAKAELKAKQSE